MTSPDDTVDAANERIASLVDPAISILVTTMAKAPPAAQVAAAREILDRAGVRPGPPAAKPPTDKRKCGARTRQGEHGPCQRPAGWGTDHPGYGTCKLHGGCTRSQREHLRAEMAADQLVALGQEVDVDPESALLALVRKTAGDVKFWEGLVGLLEPVNADDEWSVAGPNHLGDAALHVFVRGYTEAVERAADVASRAIKAGLQLRQAELAEEEGSLIRELLERLVSEVRAAPSDADALRIIGARMRELTPGNEGSAA